MAQKELKVVFSGDTKTYRKEIDKAAVATTKFQKDAGSAMSDLAGVFGVNIGDIKGKINDLGKTFSLLHNSMKASAAGATIFEGAMKVVKIATIASGIGALVVVVGSLIAYFTKTKAGADFVKTAMAALGAAVRTVIDHFSSFGEGIVKLFKGDWAGSAAAFKASVSGIGKELVENAKAAAELERRTQALNATERESKVVNEEKMAQAAELRRDAKDTENFDAAERKKKLLEAKNLITEVNNDEKAIAKERLDIFQSQMKLRKASTDDLNDEVDLKMKVSEIDRNAAQEQKALFREMKAVNTQIQAQTKALQDKYDEERKQAIKDVGGKPKEMYAMGGVIQTPKLELVGVQKYKDQLNSANIAGQNAAEKMKSSTLDLSGAINGALTNVAEGTGEMIGAFLSGSGSAENFAMMVAGAFADMAITVGKMAIATGLATFGIKKALESLNPAVAIGAGIALIALGTMVKGKMKSLASGGATSASIGSGTDGSGNYNYDSRQSLATPKMQTVNVVVTGELKTKGSDLAYVFDQEKQRKAIVT